MVDEDRSISSSLLMDRLTGKEGIDLVITDREKAEKMLENSQVEQIFIIKPGFAGSIERGESDGLIEMYSSPSSYSADFTREVVAGEAIRIIMNSMAANDVISKYSELGMDMGSDFRDEVEAYADSFWEPEPLMTIDYRELRGTAAEPVDRVSMPAATASSAGLITAFIMFFMLFGSGWLVEERTNGTIKRLGAGHGAVAVSFGGSILALLAAGILQIMMFSIILKVFFDIVLFNGILSYLALLTYLLAVIAISMFLSSVLKTQAQLQAGAPVIALLTGFMGGCFWNFIEMPERIRFLSLLTPQGWALNALNSLLLAPDDVSVMLLPALVLLGIPLILLPASYIIIRMQLRKG
jgi:ABC-2 type transport system permease protein